VVHAAFAAAGVGNNGRLGPHTLRKTWAGKVYRNRGNDIMMLKAALDRSDVSITQKYPEADEDEVMAAIAKYDFTGGPSTEPINKPFARFGARLGMPVSPVVAF
jgi:integrase